MNDDVKINDENNKPDTAQNVAPASESISKPSVKPNARRSAKPNVKPSVTEDKSTASKKRQLEKLIAIQDRNLSRLAEVQAEISATDEKISSLKKEIAIDEALALAEIVLATNYSPKEIMQKFVAGDFDALHRMQKKSTKK
ncbi:MAG: hypothetical protein FWE20_10205 [Defluviitaleaceae bacterium]|nr:hypothetical protein [Defluviitaleaceae bacterium]